MVTKIEEDCLQEIQSGVYTQIVPLIVILIPIVGLSTNMRILIRMIEMREIENHTLTEIADIQIFLFTIKAIQYRSIYDSPSFELLLLVIIETALRMRKNAVSP